MTCLANHGPLLRKELRHKCDLSVENWKLLSPELLELKLITIVGGTVAPTRLGLALVGAD